MVTEFGFRIFCTEVTRAYLQSAEALNGNIFIKPCKKFNSDNEELIKLQKPLYRIFEIGDYLSWTFRKHLIKHIGMEAYISDPAMVYNHRGQKLIGLCAAYVDKTFRAGSEKYSNRYENAEKQLTDETRE